MSGVDQKKLIERARKVEGQASAVRRMIEEDRHCNKILQQVAALNSAAQCLAILLLKTTSRRVSPKKRALRPSSTKPRP